MSPLEDKELYCIIFSAQHHHTHNRILNGRNKSRTASVHDNERVAPKRTQRSRSSAPAGAPPPLLLGPAGFTNDPNPPPKDAAPAAAAAGGRV
jgi:hypothetical protein